MTNKELMKKTFDAVHLSETAKQKILDMEKNTNHQKKQKPMRRLLPLTAALALIFGLSCAVYGVVNMYNTHWGVGSAENESFEELTKPFATESSSSPYPSSEDSENGTADGNGESAYTAGNSSESSSGRSDIIKDYRNLHIEGSTEVEVTDGKIPSVWFSLAHMIILTGPDGSGWDLETGETLSFEFSFMNSQSLAMELGYAYNGVYYDMEYGTMLNDYNDTTMIGNTIHYTITAEKAGTYYFCITNRTSENAVIESGRVFRGALPDLLVTSDIIDFPAYSSTENENDMILIACDAETQDGTFTRVHAVHNQIIVFTKPEKEGWELKKGDTLHLEAVLENSLAGEVQVGYILDNACYPLSDKTDGAGLSETFTAPEDGTYYFYMINRSGEEVIISEGRIY